jgi:hypothetical protein
MPDRVEKYVMGGRNWERFETPGEPWPLPWPIGIIPVVHFRWKDSGGTWGESEIQPLIPIQELINKAVLDAVEVGDSQAFQRPIISGMKAPDTPISFAINDVIFLDPGAGGVVPTVTVIPPGDLAGMRGQVEAFITWMAQLAEIPRQYFMETSQVASGDTQRADDSMLVAKVASESVPLGNAWEDVMKIALKYNREYNGGPAIDEDTRIATKWAEFSRVDPLALELQRADVVGRLVDAGAAIEGVVALPRLGYTAEEQQRLIQGDVIRPGVTQ